MRDSVRRTGDASRIAACPPERWTIASRPRRSSSVWSGSRSVAFIRHRPPAPGLVDLPRGRDQADVAEGLREVAEQLAAGGVDLLRQQAEVVRVAGRAGRTAPPRDRSRRPAPGTRRARTSRSRTCPPRRSRPSALSALAGCGSAARGRPRSGRAAIASIVERMRWSVAGRKPTSGISSAAASSSSESKACA